MKNKLFHLLVALGMGLISWQSEAQLNSLTYGIDRSTGNFIATDVWNSREYDSMIKESGSSHVRRAFILGSTFELESGETNLEGSIIMGFYAPAGNNNPNRFITFFGVKVFDDAGSLGADYYGDDGGYPIANPKPISLMKIEPLSHEKTKAGEVLWILKLSYSVELQEPVDFMPNIDIHFEMSAGNIELDFPGSQYKTTASDLKRQLQKSVIATNNLVRANKTNVPAASVVQSSGTITSKLPEINMSITKQDGFLLITFSPVVAGANLEQANVNSYPWAWQPAITVTNNSTTNGWYVDPNLEPRVFRVRIDR